MSGGEILEKQVTDQFEAARPCASSIYLTARRCCPRVRCAVQPPGLVSPDLCRFMLPGYTDTMVEARSRSMAAGRRHEYSGAARCWRRLPRSSLPVPATCCSQPKSHARRPESKRRTS